jgi:hypothetical protein
MMSIIEDNELVAVDGGNQQWCVYVIGPVILPLPIGDDWLCIGIRW